MSFTLTTLSPPENVPAEYSVPFVSPSVATAPVPYTRKHPLIVPPFVMMVKASAADSDFEPPDAALQCVFVVSRAARDFLPAVEGGRTPQEAGS